MWDLWKLLMLSDLAAGKQYKSLSAGLKDRRLEKSISVAALKDAQWRNHKHVRCYSCLPNARNSGSTRRWKELEYRIDYKTQCALQS
jgi:hypothetical protein